MKELFIEALRKTEIGNNLFFRVKKFLGRLPEPDMEFPELISLEVSSFCNLSCIHCPPQMKEYSGGRRKHNNIDIELFYKMMDEIDLRGPRRIALHKDGEPLLHPRIIDILCRVKKNVPHIVYLTTNAQLLTNEITHSILNNKIDVVNFSLGAATKEFYEKVRGKNFETVIGNVSNFIEEASQQISAPRIIAQIINLPEFPEMEKEIAAFRKKWEGANVEVSVWDKLSWGIFDDKSRASYRYPCYSLWDSFYVNSNGAATACCMDWKQELVLGNAFEESIAQMWKGEQIKNLRKKHLSNRAEDIPAACKKCNYWQWQPMLFDYEI